MGETFPENEQKQAKEHGFLFTPDPRRGDEWPKFQNGNIHVWSILMPQGPLITYKWMRAVLGDDGLYHSHQRFESLDEALKGCANGHVHVSP